jgi:hypothetical protein
MFKNIARTLRNIARAAIQPASQVAPSTLKAALTDKELAFTGRGKSGKVSHKKGNAAALKRASKKANNIRKFN